MFNRLFLFVVALLWVGVASPATADRPDTLAPNEGIRDNTPSSHAFVNATIWVSPDRSLNDATLVIRDGLVTAVGSDIEVPADARVWDARDKFIYAGFIDAFSEHEFDAPTKDGTVHPNPYVVPQVNVADVYKSDDKLNKKLRSQGITARLVAPAGGIIKGTSALVSTGDVASRQAILANKTALHMRLTPPKGRSRKQYPSSPMGAVALIRQSFYDANWYRDIWKATKTESGLPRPQHNTSLAALQPYSDDLQLVVVDAPDEQFVLRADRLAREFGLKVALRGSGREYRRLDAVRATGRTLIVPVSFPKPPNVATVEAAVNVNLEQLMHWDHAPENLARLQAAGVKFAVTTHGLKDKSEFIRYLRRVVKRGLKKADAIRSLTMRPAELFGMQDQLGSLQTGKMASFVICDGDLFEDKTKVLETWVEGKRHEVADDSIDQDIRGTWAFDDGGSRTAIQIKLAGDRKKLKGTVSRAGASQGAKSEVKLDQVRFDGNQLTATFVADKLDRDGIAQLSAVLVREENDSDRKLIGNWQWPDGSLVATQAKRTGPFSKPKEEDKKAADDKKTKSHSFPVNYPLGAYGVLEPPSQARVVAFANATVWTSGPKGILKDATVLVRDGKIVSVGKNLEIPSAAEVVDCKGKHVSPGIIDCHSHMATDGGINEGTQAITAEVRIGDFIDASDISIYRQLAGGVTTSNILHGSANPIGGQNQVIKLRWGALPEAMKFAAAPGGIKFALGENVKQSNWGEEFRTRYPQSRMGVEQVARDAFTNALRYEQRWQAWQQNRQGLPPRRDLETETLLEILNGSRWIHCHSYRQDEILALLRTLESFDVTIGTLQHILEGYKVAEVMKQHGAMGSSFSDWWAYKFEVLDAIPYNGTLMHNAGIVVSFNSDDAELARHLNHEAAKAVKYGSVEPVEALKFVTLNPARQLRIDQYVGSLEPGKHADLVVWSRSPLSTLSRCEQTWIDGRKYFDRSDDQTTRKKTEEMRATLIQKVLASGLEMLKPGESAPDEKELWPREDIYCGHHGHGHGHQH